MRCRNQFLVYLVYPAKERTQKLLDEERLVRLSRSDARIFLAALENSPPVNGAMKRAARRHTEVVGRADI